MPRAARPAVQLQGGASRRADDLDAFAGRECLERGGEQDLQPAAELQPLGVEAPRAHVAGVAAAIASASAE
jgi:hypothetical protein